MVIDTEAEATTEEQYELALESILRWCKRSEDVDFEDMFIVQAIKQVATTALGPRNDN